MHIVRRVRNSEVQGIDFSESLSCREELQLKRMKALMKPLTKSKKRTESGEKGKNCGEGPGLK